MGLHLSPFRLLSHNTTDWVTFKLLCLIVLEAVKSKIMVSGEDLSWAGDCQTFTVTSQGGSSWGDLWGFVYKSTDFIHEGSTCMTYVALKAPPPSTIM